jgi:hypothetical protein
MYHGNLIGICLAHLPNHEIRKVNMQYEQQSPDEKQIVRYSVIANGLEFQKICNNRRTTHRLVLSMMYWRTSCSQNLRKYASHGSCIGSRENLTPRTGPVTR